MLDTIITWGPQNPTEEIVWQCYLADMRNFIKRGWTESQACARAKWAVNPEAVVEISTGVSKRRKHPTFYGKA